MTLIKNIFGILGILFILTSCGGSSETTHGVALPNNLVKIRVDKGVTKDYINGLFTTVTLCPPGGGACTDIDNILVDTGSTGLRLISSAIPSSYPQDNFHIKNNLTVAECAQFVSGVMWGPMMMSDIKMGGEIAHNISVHLIGKDSFPAAPEECTSRGQLLNTVENLSANGVLGISNFINDCGLFCVNNISNNYYYACGESGCQPIPVSEDEQIQNPVVHFAKNNNGTIISLPEVSGSSAQLIEGDLIFGINTESNNELGNAHRISLNPKTATFSTIYKNFDYSVSYFDSGSNAIYFDDGSINQCALSGFEGYYCPAQNINIEVILKGVNSELNSYSFIVGDAVSLLRKSTVNAAQPYLASTSGGASQEFVWGLPFFFGKKFYTSIEDKSNPEKGIYCAYQ